MSGFEANWLALREPADHRSRNSYLADALQAYFAMRDTVRVIDLGSGTGSNLRATAPLLPAHQQWTLIDNDTDLLDASKTKLIAWSDKSDFVNNTLHLKKGNLVLEVTFNAVDLANDVDAALGGNPDLVTASALFDLASPSAIGEMAKEISKRRATFYTVLTYNGVQQWQPRHPTDNVLIAAYHSHQRIDKGFGPSAGPTAPPILADRFKSSGYRVQEGDSPWELSAPDDTALIEELRSGYIKAVIETGKVDEATIEQWSERQLTGCVVGHTDTLALPGHNMFMDDPDDDEEDLI